VIVNALGATGAEPDGNDGQLIALLDAVAEGRAAARRLPSHPSPPRKSRRRPRRSGPHPVRAAAPPPLAAVPAPVPARAPAAEPPHAPETPAEVPAGGQDIRVGVDVSKTS